MRLDFDRATRTGDPEVVFGQGKTPDQVVDALTELHRAHPARAVLATRVSDEARQAVEASPLPASWYGPARSFVVGPIPQPRGIVAILSAGTSDQHVAAEVEITCGVYGAGVRRVDDVGVAGLHRLLSARDQFVNADVIVVVAGMEGALPSVVGGLVGQPVIAVPTSVGYGASLGGLSALLGMLNSCAPGVVVTNIDNGFGAGVHAARIARTVGELRSRAEDQESDSEPDEGAEDPA